MYRTSKLLSFYPQVNFLTIQHCCSLVVKRTISQSVALSGFASLDDGAELYYEQAGNGSHTILCIPGALGSTRSDFSYQLDHLSKDFTVLAYDPRGYGKSQKTKRQFSSNFYHQDAADAGELMEKLGHNKYSILGWSDGGMIGLILAAQQKETIENLVIWGSNSYISEEDKRLIENTRDLDKWSERMRVPLQKVYGKEGLKDLWNGWMDAYVAFGDNPEGNICIPELKEISCPTLIIHGAKDALVPSFHAEFINNHVQNSRLLIMPNGKHNLHMRYYEEFNKLVTEFVKGNSKL